VIILGIDTATRVSAVGVVYGREVLADVFDVSTTGHAASLPGLVGRAVGEAGIALEAVEAIAVSTGPGSFTGLRVGVSFAKGLALSGGCALAGVGTLDALAALAPERYESIATVLDARRGEVYLAVFRRTAAGIGRCGPDEAMEPAAAAARVRERIGGAGAAIVLGDGAERHPECFRDLAGSRITVAGLTSIHPLGGAVALLAAPRLERGEAERIEALAPRYVRASAAERSAEGGSLTTEKTVS
jgi:tRNA threonylcarbamoyladenosine biosynthesis protein TsaB